MSDLDPFTAHSFGSGLNLDSVLSPLLQETAASTDPMVITEEKNTAASQTLGTNQNQPPNHTGTKSLLQLSTEAIIADLSSALDGYQAKAMYCVGGKVPISSSPLTYGSASKPITAPPIALRFETSHGQHAKVQFPLDTNNSGLQDLLDACEPATFGSRGKDILDEQYRKAIKLDRSQFAVDFHPHDYGIVDAIAQTLLPGIGRLGEEELKSSRNGDAEHRGVRCELYKLNVYEGPSGKFKKHIDTPRGATQFGSLVVCLPCSHEGGQLQVSHKGHNSIFDWSNAGVEEIQWCAFYSDCEHEVLEVNSGQRVTLTYNLYVSEQVGGILQKYPTAEPSLFPLFQGAKSMIDNPAFMSDGATLGFFCAHQYAHTRKITKKLMPYALKGVDSVLFSVFQALGVVVTVRPVMSGEAYEEYIDNLVENDLLRERLEDHDSNCDGDCEAEKQAEAELRNVTRIGDYFAALQLEDRLVEGGDPMEEMSHCWPFEDYKNVIWLNDARRRGWEVAMVNMKYGNEASLAWQYSHVAILIELPPRQERISTPPTEGGIKRKFEDLQRGENSVDTTSKASMP